MIKTHLVGVLLLVGGIALGGCGKTQQCVDYSKVVVPDVCQLSYDPVCGCDDNTYQNECFARKRGVINWVGGPCLN